MDGLGSPIVSGSLRRLGPVTSWLFGLRPQLGNYFSLLALAWRHSKTVLKTLLARQLRPATLPRRSFSLEPAERSADRRRSPADQHHQDRVAAPAVETGNRADLSSETWHGSHSLTWWDRIPDKKPARRRIVK